MREIPPSVSLMLDIEARQDEVLRQLAELDERSRPRAHRVCRLLSP